MLQRQPLHGPVTEEALRAPVSAAMRGFVQLAAIHDLRMNPDERPRIEERVRAIENTGQARAYVDDVATRLDTRLGVLRQQLPKAKVRRRRATR